MTVETEQGLTHQITNTPSYVEHRLVTAMRNALEQWATKDPVIEAALLAAESLKPGLVIATEDHASEIADLVRQVIDGDRCLAEKVKALVRIPQQAEDAVRVTARRVAGEKIALAKAVGNTARVEFQQTLRRRAEEEEQRVRAAAAAADARAAEVAIESGEDVPPPVETAPVAVRRTISGGAGKMGTQVRINPVEIVNDAECPAAWKELKESVARASFNAAVMEKKVERPKPGGYVIWQGVKFCAVESAVNR